MDGWLHISISHPLATVARFHPVARLLRMGPRISIDGREVSQSYSSASFNLPPGRHLLEIWMHWLLMPRAQEASQYVEISAGQQVVARYYAARFRGGPGRIELDSPRSPVPEARIHHD